MKKNYKISDLVFDNEGIAEFKFKNGCYVVVEKYPREVVEMAEKEMDGYKLGDYNISMFYPDADTCGWYADFVEEERIENYMNEVAKYRRFVSGIIVSFKPIGIHLIRDWTD